MKFPLSLALSLGLSAGIAFAQDSTYDADTVLAEVNGKTITLGHVIALRMRLPDQYKNLPDEVLYGGILDQLIDQTILSDHVKSQDGYDGRAVDLVLENESRGIVAAGLVEQYRSKPLPEGAIEKAYEEALAEMPDEAEVNASHILVESEDEAKALVEALAGGADFAELAKEKSTGPSGPSGGQLGWFGAGQMVPPFEAAAMALEAGEVSAPVQTQFGWHVIKLNEKRNKPKPTLEQLAPQLTEKLKQDAVNAELEGLRASAAVTRAEVTIPPAAIRQLELIGR